MNTPVPASSSDQRKLVEGIWREVLGLAEIDPDRSFADLGGTSLGANQLVAKLAKRLGIEVPVIRIFEFPTLRQFQRYLAQGPNADLLPDAALADAATPADAAVSDAAQAPPASHDVAIVGMACRFPGAKDVTEFWQNLIEGRDSIRKLSDQEISPSVPQELRNDPRYVRAAGMVDEPYAMDAAFFDINPMEARLTDPQQRLLLEASWDALENAGHGPGSFVGRAAVFAGTEDNSYYKTDIVPFPEAEARAGRLSVMTGNEKDFVAMRVAHKLDLRGPAVSVHTACSTSLVAAIMACKSLRNGECDIALAGGASVHFPTPEGYYFQEGGIFSSDGHCRPFDQDAEGTVFTDGVGVVVLKRLDDALRDRNTIFAVIKGGAINNDGAAKISFSAPSVSGQATCIADALRDAGVDAGSIGYVEAHGTATPVGDPIEVEGLRQAFGKHLGKRQFCGLGSVKSNIGHTTAAAGVASLIKTALALRHGVIPASLHYRRPNPALELENSPFYIVDSNRDWARGAAPRRAGVSSFGIGGTNAHLVLEEAPAAIAADAAEGSRPFEILPVSARTASQRDRLLQSLDAEPHDLRDVAYTLQQGRTRFKHRGAAIRLAHWPHANTQVQPPQVALEDPCPVFLFPGQGSQYIQMGLSLSAEFPEFRATFSRCCRLLSEEMGLDFEAFIFDPANQQTLEDTRFTQPALYAIEVSLGRMLLDWGLRPQLMVGHSVGEFAAAHLAGVFSLEDGIRLIAARGRLMTALPRGRMLSARAGIDAVLAAAAEPVDVASINSPVHSVLAGADELIARIQARLEAAGIPCRPLHTSHAFHSEMMTPVVEPFLEIVRSVRLQPPRIPIISTVTGEPMRDTDATDPAYWARHLRATVKFSPALQRAIRDGGNLFIEVGPRTTLTSLAALHFAKDGAPCFAVSLLGDTPEPEAEVLGLATALARIWTSGLELPWQRIWPAGKLVPFCATYPFERKNFRFSEGRQAQRASAAAPLAAAVIAAPAAPAPALAPAPASATVQDQAALLQQQLATLFGEFAGMAIEQPEISFIEAGFDSLVLMQIGVELGKKFGVSVSLGDLMRKHNTLRLLTSHLMQSAEPARLPAARAVTPIVVAPAAAAVVPSIGVAPPLAEPAPSTVAAGQDVAALLNAQLAALFADFAGMAIDQPDTTFVEAGFDSLVLMQIGVELGKKFGTSVSLGDLMRKHNTLSRLTAYLLQSAAPGRLPQVQVQAPVPVPAQPVAPLPAPPAAAAHADLAPPPAAVAMPGAVAFALPAGARLDAAALVDAQLRHMKEIFELQLRYLGTSATAQARPASLPAHVAHVPPVAPAAVPVRPTPAPVAVLAAGERAPAAGDLSASLVHRPEASDAPLTPMQERIRFMEEMQPGRAVYSIASAHRLTGALEPAVFAQALREVVRRQSALRTCIVRSDDGKWLQRVHPSVDFRLPYADLAVLPEEQREEELQSQVQAIVDQPFDIHSAPLFRAALWKIAEERYTFLFVPHHLIWDGWSFDLFFAELAASYGALLRGATPDLPALPLTYGDFSRGYAQWEHGADAAAQIEYWKSLFAALPPPQPLLTDRPRAAARSGRGGVEWMKLDKDRAEGLRGIARGAGASLNMLMTAAYAAVIQQAVGSEQIVLGVVVRGRRQAELEPIMGFFNNLLPLPLRIDRSAPFPQWVGTVGDQIAAAYDRQDVPFERLSSEPQIAAWARRAGVPYHALISFQDARRREPAWAGLAHQPMPFAHYTATEDYGFWVTEYVDGIEGRLVYDADIIDAASAQLLCRRLETFLVRILEQPGSTLAELTSPDAAEAARIAGWSAAAGAQVLDAGRQTVPAGAVGALWQAGQDTGRLGRWRPDGSLQTLDPATVQGPAAVARAPVPRGEAAAMSPTEQVLAEVWSAILGIAAIRPTDNFFELGGTSLQAMQASTQIEQRLGRAIHARKFVMETLRSLARGFDVQSATATGTDVPRDADAGLSEESERAAARGAARRQRNGGRGSSLVARLAEVFRRPVSGPAADTAAPVSEVRTAPVPVADPALPAKDVPAERTQPLPATLPATRPGRLRMVRHAQPPAPGAFRAPADRDAPVWHRQDASSGRYEIYREN